MPRQDEWLNCRSSSPRVPFDSRPIHIAHTPAVKILNGIMHRAAVVPHDEVVRPPSMPIDELRLDGVPKEKLEQELTLVGVQTDNMCREAGINVEEIPPRLRMDGHDGMPDRRRSADLPLRRLKGREVRKRTLEQMFGGQAVQHLLQWRGQSLIGTIHTREHGVATHRGDFDGVEQRRLGWWLEVGIIGVPVVSGVRISQIFPVFVFLVRHPL